MQKLIKWAFSIPFIANNGFKLFIWWQGAKSKLKRWLCLHRHKKTVYVDVQDRFVHEACINCKKDFFSEC